MNYPTDLKYSKTHEWVKEEDGLTVVGISDFAQDSLGDIVFIGLPSVGDTVTMGEALGDVESVKAVSDIICPVTGVVEEVNEDLADAPENLKSVRLLDHQGQGSLRYRRAARRCCVRSVLRNRGGVIWALMFLPLRRNESKCWHRSASSR